MKIEREYIVEVKARKHRKTIRGKTYIITEGYITLNISLPQKLIGKKVRLRVLIEPVETEQDKKQEKTPPRELLYRLIEEVYLRLGGRYGEPVLVGNIEIWGFRGIFEDLNKELEKLGYRPLSWSEFVDLVKELDSSRYYGKIYVTFLASPKGTVEPHNIIIYRPTFLQA